MPAAPRTNRSPTSSAGANSGASIFAVSPATLIPRPESETLIEAALAAFANRTPPRRILDLGTGTGCLLLSALHEFPGAFGIGADRAPEAVSLAAANAATLGLAGRAAFLCGDWAAALDARFDLVLCNPPYIPTSDIDGLMQEVARHEPQGALDGGADGLAAYRRILPSLLALLQPDGVAVLELGVGQAYTVLALAREIRLDCHNSAGFGGHCAGNGAAIGNVHEETVWHGAASGLVCGCGEDRRVAADPGQLGRLGFPPVYWAAGNGWTARRNQRRWIEVRPRGTGPRGARAASGASHHSPALPAIRKA